MGRKRQKDKYLPPRVYFKNGALYYVDKNNKWHYLAKALPEAMAIWSQKYAEPKKITTMNDLIERYLAEVSPLKGAKTYENEIYATKLLKAVFGEMDVNDMTPVHIYAYMDKRCKKSAAGANKERAVLSNIFTLAIRWGVTSQNPCRDVKAIKTKKRDRYIEDREFEAVKAMASPFMRAAMDFAYLTGLRKSDILNLKEENIFPDGIKLITLKTGAKINIVLTPALNKCLQEAKKARSVRSCYIFCTEKGTQYTEHGFNANWQRLKNKAIEKGMTLNFHFHDIRRKTATDADKLHGREYARQLLTHSSQKMTSAYISGYETVKPLR